MNAPLRLHPTLSETLRQQASSIYRTWYEGNKSTAHAMLNQVPPKRIAYVVFTLTILAIADGEQHAMSHFMEAVTK